MGNNNGVYSPDQVVLTVKGKRIFNFDEGEFIRTERDVEEEFRRKGGAQGDYTFVKNLDKGGSIIFTLQMTAPENAYLHSLKEAEELFSISVSRTSVGAASNILESVTGTNCMIGISPRKSFDQDTSPREWSIIVGEMVETDKLI